MKLAPQLLSVLAVAAGILTTSLRADPGNANIDMPGFLRVANQAAVHRQTHRVSEEEFLRMSHEPGTLILDARSARKYNLLHILGAVNLNFRTSTSTPSTKSCPTKTNAS